MNEKDKPSVLFFMGDDEIYIKIQIAANEAEKLSTVNALAKPLRTSHTSSGTFRIWYKGYFGKIEEQIQYKYTTWGSYDEAMSLVNIASGVRVDRYDEHGWVTIWLTSVEYLTLLPLPRSAHRKNGCSRSTERNRTAGLDIQLQHHGRAV